MNQSGNANRHEPMRGLQPKLTGPSGLGAVTAAGELPVEPEILELFRGWRARATGEFVLESDRPPRSLDYEYYRCEPTFKTLVEWLRSKRGPGQQTTSGVAKALRLGACRSARAARGFQRASSRRY
jgi:hypothetical protein